jgi:hypothetical protein
MTGRARLGLAPAGLEVSGLRRGRRRQRDGDDREAGEPVESAQRL